MCLSLPGKIVKIKDQIATIDYNGEQREASTLLLPDVKVGEYVIVSSQVIMQVVPEEEAKKTIKLWDQTSS